ncbi:maltotransferase domain-containing protein [Lentzea kentuckyensis]|uniref:maltotransferase domain-containing protein n=1 Tax=Lentzea kentuckyensis TaxID=360086 RepID=UPI001FEB2308|nr:maltotransferase domain-containing protein [Lentzea kentuckyensis]
MWREGHDAVAATVVWQGAGGTREVRMVPHPSDPWGTWRHAVEAKAGAGQSATEMANDLEIGAVAGPGRRTSALRDRARCRGAATAPARRDRSARRRTFVAGPRHGICHGSPRWASTSCTSRPFIPSAR